MERKNDTGVTSLGLGWLAGVFSVDPRRLLSQGNAGACAARVTMSSRREPQASSERSLSLGNLAFDPPSPASKILVCRRFIHSLIFSQNIAFCSRQWQSRKPAFSFRAEGRTRARTMIATDKSQPLVFLAEDSEDDAFFFQRAFHKAQVGCSLLRAENGKVAIEMLRRNADEFQVTPILMFLDLKMPVMSGFEVLEWLRFSGLEPAPKVVVLSGSNDQDDRVRAFGLGAADYLVKPITTELLREKVLGQLELLRHGQNETRATV
jgi:CheY-like chemotaxis protein